MYLVGTRCDGTAETLCTIMRCATGQNECIINVSIDTYVPTLDFWFEVLKFGGTIGIRVGLWDAFVHSRFNLKASNNE